MAHRRRRTVLGVEASPQALGLAFGGFCVGFWGVERVLGVPGSLRPSLATFPWPVFFALTVAPVVMLGAASFDRAEFSNDGRPRLRFIAVLGGVVLASILAAGLPILYGIWQRETFDHLWQLSIWGWTALIIVQCCYKIFSDIILKNS